MIPDKATYAAVAFVKSTKRDQWESDHKAVQQADLREHCEKLTGDSMKALVEKS